MIGLLSLWLRDVLPVNLISAWGERLVGVMLIAIGAWAITKPSGVYTHEHEHDGTRHLHLHAHTHAGEHRTPSAHEHHTHAAFGIGILHGLAGSSHFLGVLPILAFPTRVQACAYLLTFGIGTVLSMALFSHGMGWVANKWGGASLRIYRGLLSSCAALAIGVGVFWLIN